MATYDEHMQHAQHNEEISDLLLNPKCASVTWVVVTAFYSAMQYIEAAVFNLQCKHLQHYFDFCNQTGEFKGSIHKSTEIYIYNEPRLKNIYLDYQELRRASETVRYLRNNNYFDAENAREFFEDNLSQIKQHLSNEKLICS